MDEKIKNKVREIQRKYCAESVETKLYWAIKETMDKIKQLEKELIKGRNYKTSYWELFYPDGTSSVFNYNPLLNTTPTKPKTK